MRCSYRKLHSIFEANGFHRVSLSGLIQDYNLGALLSGVFQELQAYEMLVYFRDAITLENEFYCFVKYDGENYYPIVIVQQDHYDIDECRIILERANIDVNALKPAKTDGDS